MEKSRKDEQQVLVANLHGQLMAAQDLFRRVSPRPTDEQKDKAENEFKEVRKKFLAMASEARPPYEDVKKEYEKAF